MIENNPHTRQGNLNNYFLLFALCVAFFTAYYPVWKNLVSAWANDENYSHGFVIVPLALFILWRRRGQLQKAVSPAQSKGLILVGASLLGYIFALAGEIETLASISMIFFLGGTIWYVWGFRVLRLSLFPLALLVLMIPVPAQLLAALTIPLQLLVTRIAGMLARAMGIPIFIEGNLIRLPLQTFEVVDACSGLRSIMSLVTLGAFMGYFALETLWQRLALIASALPIAIVANSVRVLAMVIFSFYFNIDLLHGDVHTIFGMGIFVVSLCLFFGVQKILAQCRKR